MLFDKITIFTLIKDKKVFIYFSKFVITYTSSNKTK